MSKAARIPKDSDIPYVVGCFVIERVGVDNVQVQKVKIVCQVGDHVQTSTQRWYDRWTGSRIPANVGIYRAIHSLGYADG